jgi:hypothetical protein
MAVLSESHGGPVELTVVADEAHLARYVYSIATTELFLRAAEENL